VSRGSGGRASTANQIWTLTLPATAHDVVTRRGRSPPESSKILGAYVGFAVGRGLPGLILKGNAALRGFLARVGGHLEAKI